MTNAVATFIGVCREHIESCTCPKCKSKLKVVGKEFNYIACCEDFHKKLFQLIEEFTEPYGFHSGKEDDDKIDEIT